MRFALLLSVVLVSSSALLAEPVVGEWPRWRGPLDNGMARGSAPVNWSDTENVKWKVEVPGRGHSSPVIWENKLFVTSAVTIGEASGPAAAAGGLGGGEGAGTEQKLLVLCYDRETGKKLWEQTAAVAKPHEGYHHDYGSFASNSPVTDGERLVAFFGSRGVYVYDLEGKLLWKRTDFPQMRMRLGFGEGIAPVLHENTLLLTFDHEGDSFLLALDKRDGSELWRTARDEISNWAPPLVFTHEGVTQALIAAPNKVRSYDVATGKLIWECAGLGANTIPTPVYDGERVYVMSGFRDPNLLAIKLPAAGDITGSESIVWTNQRGNSYSASPVLYEGILYFVTDRGMISAFNAATGEPYYHQQRLPNPYSLKSSPVGRGRQALRVDRAGRRGRGEDGAGVRGAGG